MTYFFNEEKIPRYLPHSGSSEWVKSILEILLFLIL